MMTEKELDFLNDSFKGLSTSRTGGLDWYSSKENLPEGWLEFCRKFYRLRNPRNPWFQKEKKAEYQDWLLDQAQKYGEEKAEVN